MIDEQTRKRSSFWRELPILLGVAIVVAVLVRAFVLQTFYIPSESMENTLEINDRVLVNKLVYDFRDPHRGEVVVFEAPRSWRSNPAEEDFIKRVIGVAGDHIKCCDADRKLIVNGQSLDEPYLYSDGNGTSDVASEDDFEITVPQGRLWVMGDHRSHSGDSREQYRASHDVVASTIPVDAVVGRAFVVFWPLGRAGWLSVPDSFSRVPDPPKG
ncbi:MAG TPA: signal peptidase I [Micromonosporaceae bacterium]|nr:signal peptidase I [Micromonosporaceae bacterium]